MNTPTIALLALLTLNAHASNSLFGDGKTYHHDWEAQDTRTVDEVYQGLKKWDCDKSGSIEKDTRTLPANKTKLKQIKQIVNKDGAEQWKKVQGDRKPADEFNGALYESGLGGHPEPSGHEVGTKERVEHPSEEHPHVHRNNGTGIGVGLGGIMESMKQIEYFCHEGYEKISHSSADLSKEFQRRIDEGKDAVDGLQKMVAEMDKLSGFVSPYSEFRQCYNSLRDLHKKAKNFVDELGTRKQATEYAASQMDKQRKVCQSAH